MLRYVILFAQAGMVGAAATLAAYIYGAPQITYAVLFACGFLFGALFGERPL